MIFDIFVCIHMRVYTDMAQYMDVCIICEIVLLRHYVTAKRLCGNFDVCACVTKTVTALTDDLDY